MPISIFDLFSIGVGPSSSHTVGPMRAAQHFAQAVVGTSNLASLTRVCIELYGSLALTGVGHGTDKAVLMGLENELPESINPSDIEARKSRIIQQQQLHFAGQKTLHFHADTDLCWHMADVLPEHSNGMRFTAFDEHGDSLLSKEYYSIGGGFIVEAGQTAALVETETTMPYPFATAAELWTHCEKENSTISDIMMQNECAQRSEKAVRTGVLGIAKVMLDSIERGCHTEGILPGGLAVKRRAPSLYRELAEELTGTVEHPSTQMNILNAYAIAVNEENAAGGRIVTAPTNGAAGIIPAVLKYFQSVHGLNSGQHTIDYLLTACAIGILYKKGASISAAEVGCQGEIGVACSMAAGGLAAVMDGTLAQIENAAEMAMEHHLGLTCDPIAGLVQVPCIERNAMGAVQAVNSAYLALRESGIETKVSLDDVICTMARTGEDMMTKYKETSQGGLAAIKVSVQLPEC